MILTIPSGAKREEQSENLSETEEFSDDGSDGDHAEAQDKPAESSNSGGKSSSMIQS